MSHSCLRLLTRNVFIYFKESLILIILFLLYGAGIQAQQGLKAEYYDGTDFNRLAAVKYVMNIDQYWNNRPPVPGINPHRCSIRWTGKLKPGKSGAYVFSARVDDGIRVWIDDRLIINQWGLNDVGIFEGTVNLIANQMYDLKVEYFNALVEGEVRLLWKIPKVDKSWYERIFGENNSAKVIAPEYFYWPDEPEQNSAELAGTTNNDLPEPQAQEKPKIVKPPITNSDKNKQSDNLSAEPTKTEKPDAAVVEASVKEAEKFIPKNVEFERAKTVILKSSYKELNAFAQFMLEHPHVKVMIEGHTDPVGDAKMNLQLSKQRALRIANYLIDKGIDSKRIKAEGYGGSRPLVVPEKGSYYPANRRVVFIVSGMD